MSQTANSGSELATGVGAPPARFGATGTVLMVIGVLAAFRSASLTGSNASVYKGAVDLVLARGSSQHSRRGRTDVTAIKV